MIAYKNLIMKHISLLLALMIGTWSFANSQITITNVAFPKAGDSLQISTDNTVTGIKMPKNGVNQTYDLRSLDATAVAVSYVKKASEGTAGTKFPAAKLVELRGGLEYYINVTNDRYEEIGVAGATPALFNIDLNTKVSPARVVRRAPMNFFDLNNTSSASVISLALSALPDSLKSTLGALTAFADSIRIKSSTTRTDLIDGYGTLKLPMGDFDALREKRIAYNQSDIEAFVKFSKTWLSVTSLVPAAQLPAQIQTLLRKDTVVTYNFYGATAKEPLAIVTVDKLDNTLATQVAYKNIKKTVATKEFADEPTASTRPDIKAMPNPAVDIVNFELTNLEQGNYTVKIYNLLGMVVWEEQHSVAGSKVIRLDTNNLKKGTYL
jgi:Secretion system C-terminal sorting domain